MNRNRLLLTSILTFVMLLIGAETTAAEVDASPLQQSSEPVYALPGTLQRAEGQAFLTYFVAATGDRYAIYGATPAVDDEIVRIVDEEPDALVKIWGDLFSVGLQYPGPEIVATAVRVEPPVRTATPTPQATEQPIATGRFSYVNLHAEPSQTSPITGQIVAGETCPVIGRINTNSWLLLQCESGEGWVTSTVVGLDGNTAGIPVYGVGAYVVQIPNVSDSGIRMTETPTPTPTATPVPNDWRAQYYGNTSLAGVPVLEQDVADINFNWGYGSPGTDVPVDNFSALFDRTMNFEPNEYRLCLCNLDDGARLWINGELIIDAWAEGSARDFYIDRWLAGEQRVQIQYFEAVSLASITFRYDVIDRNADEWQVSYWNNTTMEGQAALSRSEPAGDGPYILDHNWGIGSPAPGVIASDIFSARWEGVFTFDTESYVFQAMSDDGVRVYVDDVLVLRGWSDGYSEPRSGVYSIGAGQHKVRVEYYERTGNALVSLRWYVDTSVRDQ